MDVDFGVVFDKLDSGALKVTKGENYRFTLKLREGGDLLMSIEGFRVDTSLTAVEPPVVYSRFGSIRIIKLGRDFEEKILAATRKVVGECGG